MILCPGQPENDSFVINLPWGQTLHIICVADTITLYQHDSVLIMMGQSKVKVVFANTTNIEIVFPKINHKIISPFISVCVFIPTSKETDTHTFTNAF